MTEVKRISKMFSDLQHVQIMYSDTDGTPYFFSVTCKAGRTPILIYNRKEKESWEVHYTSHNDTYCEVCGDVKLYSTCKYFTDVCKRNYELLLRFIRDEKVNLKGIKKGEYVRR